jgi:hypothetical protein
LKPTEKRRRFVATSFNKQPPFCHILVKSFLNIDIPFGDFLKITEIRQVHDLSIYWSCDGVFHETTSMGFVQKEDLQRFLNENQCEVISVHFLCNGMFEIESNGRNETVISVHEPAILDMEERNRDFMERDDLMSSLEENDKRKAATLLRTRIVE